jgi:histone-lysine N-methyltransferase SETMAR
MEEQRYAIKFCVRLGKSATETLAMLQAAYGEECLSRTRVFEWHKRFKEGRTSVDDDSGRGRPSTSVMAQNLERAEQIVLADRHVTVAELASLLSISVGSAHTILTEELGMRRVCASWVPHLLIPAHKRHRVSICHELRDRFHREGSAFLERVVTGDETWIRYYDPLSRQQSSEWKHPDSPRPTKVRHGQWEKKVMLIIFFDSTGILYVHTVPHGHTVNADYYCDVLKSLIHHIQRKRPQWPRGHWLLHHDNSSVHTSHKIITFLTNNAIETVPHPPYSPDLAPCDFYLFSHLKSDIRGQRFSTDNELNTAVQGSLQRMSNKSLHHVFLNWTERWTHCIDAKGEYFEHE